MARYVFKGGKFVDPATGDAMLVPKRDGLCVPSVISDIEPYQSPVDGRYVSGRAAKRDDLRRHGCIDANDLPRNPKRAPKGQFRNKRFAAKHNLTLSEDAR